MGDVIVRTYGGNWGRLREAEERRGRVVSCRVASVKNKVEGRRSVTVTSSAAPSVDGRQSGQSSILYL